MKTPLKPASLFKEIIEYYNQYYLLYTGHFGNILFNILQLKKKSFLHAMGINGINTPVNPTTIFKEAVPGFFV